MSADPRRDLRAASHQGVINLPQNPFRVYGIRGAEVVTKGPLSARPQRARRLCGERISSLVYRRDAKDAETAQKERERDKNSATGQYLS